MSIHWGRVTVLLTGVALLVAAAVFLLLVAEAGVWALAALLVVGLVVAVLPATSSAERQARPLEPGTRRG